MSRKVLCLDWDKCSLRIVVARIGATRTVLEDAIDQMGCFLKFLYA